MGFLKPPQTKNVDFSIECTTPTEYELKLVYHADSALINTIWNKSKKAILRKKGLDIRAHSPEEIKEFDIPHHYYKFMKVTVRNEWLKVSQDTAQDKIILLSYEVIGGNFKLNDLKGWDCTVKIKGVYSNEQHNS